MRIEFDLTKDEAILLLNSLKRVQATTKNKNTFTSISKMITEIESDAVLNDEVYNLLRLHLVHFKHKHAIMSRDAHLRLGLRLQPLFLNRADGLKAVCNRVLYKILMRYKPTAASNGVILKSVQKCIIVQDVVNLIKTTYEAAK